MASGQRVISRGLGTAIVVVCLAYAAAALLLPPGVDWRGAFYPSARAVVHGHSPYTALHAEDLTGFLNPPWVLALSVPAAALGVRAGWVIWFGIMCGTYALALIRWRYSPWIIVFSMLSPLVWITFVFGNIDGLCLLGATLSPPVGMFLVMLKPQIGVGLVVYWGVLAWQAGGWKRAAAHLLPALVALGLSLLVFGNYFSRGTALLDQWWNISAFPYTVPVGVVWLVLAVRVRESSWAMLGGLLCSPYVNAITLASLSGPLFASLVQRLVLRTRRKSHPHAHVIALKDS